MLISASNIPTENSHALVGMLKKAIRVGNGITLVPNEHSMLSKNDKAPITKTDFRTNLVNSVDDFRAMR